MAKSLNLSDDAQALIFGDPEQAADPEIPEQPKEDAATGKKLPVVKLASTARDRAPFVIRRIHPAN
jgi:hypothetical protein